MVARLGQDDRLGAVSLEPRQSHECPTQQDRRLGGDGSEHHLGRLARGRDGGDPPQSGLPLGKPVHVDGGILRHGTAPRP